MGWNRLINVLSLGVEYTYSSTQHEGGIDLWLYSAWEYSMSTDVLRTQIEYIYSDTLCTIHSTSH